MTNLARSMIGHNRFPPFQAPENDESKQVIVKPWRALLDCLREIPAHYLWSQITNREINECCRDPENLMLEIRRTQEKVIDEETGKELSYPDLYVMKCGCGRQHRRLLLEPSHIGNQDKKPLHIHNQFFKEDSDEQTE